MVPFGQIAQFSKSSKNKEHWLDYADSKYPKELINDVKSFVKVLLVFVPIPVFWTL